MQKRSKRNRIRVGDDHDGYWLYRGNRAAYLETYVTETASGRKHYLILAPLAGPVPVMQFDGADSERWGILRCLRKIESLGLAVALWQETGVIKSGSIGAAKFKCRPLAEIPHPIQT